MSINRLIDSIVRCVICGKPPGCECWITLRCPQCARTMTAERDATDPPGTAVVQVTCDKCDTGDFAGVMYFDAAGKRLGVV